MRARGGDDDGAVMLKLMVMITIEFMEVVMMTMTMSERMCRESGNKYALKWNPVLKFHVENNWLNPGKVKQFHSNDQMTECFGDSFSPYFSAKIWEWFSTISLEDTPGILDQISLQSFIHPAGLLLSIFCFLKARCHCRQISKLRDI